MWKLLFVASCWHSRRVRFRIFSLQLHGPLGVTGTCRVAFCWALAQASPRTSRAGMGCGALGLWLDGFPRPGSGRGLWLAMRRSEWKLAVVWKLERSGALEGRSWSCGWARSGGTSHFVGGTFVLPAARGLPSWPESPGITH